MWSGVVLFWVESYCALVSALSGDEQRWWDQQQLRGKPASTCLQLSIRCREQPGFRSTRLCLTRCELTVYLSAFAKHDISNDHTDPAQAVPRQQV